MRGPQLEQPVDLANVLTAGLRAKPDEVALVLRDRRWTWRELDESSRRLARNYLALGLKPGDRVASLLPNRGALIVHYLACLRSGLVATPLNYRYQAPEVDHALEESGAVLLVAHAERQDVLTSSKHIKQLKLGCVTFAGDGQPGPHLETLLYEASAGSAPPIPPPTHTPAFIFFTSGSTGKPKGVTHSHETFGWLVASAKAGLEITPNDVFLPATSASHVAACSFALAGLAAGATVVLARSFGAEELLPLLRQSRPTLLCMLPAPLFGLVREHGATREDFQSVRRFLSGGDKVSLELENEFRTLTGFEIEEVYGMTEVGTVAFNPPGAANRLGSIGLLAPAYTASIRDDRGQEVAAGETGRLCIQSPCTMIGYWNQPEATKEIIAEGWLDTGDLVSKDDADYLWFRGRKKQIIVHDGSNISPQEVEDSLLEHPAVAAAGVIGIHDLIHGENVRAYVSLRPHVPRPTRAELRLFSKSRIGYKAPDEIVVLDEMPMNATGKVDRVALKALANRANDYHARVP